MPIYDPTIHDTVTISLQEFEFLEAYTQLSSETWGNALKSALKAGYSHWYARVITQRFTREKIYELKKLYDSPKGQILLKMARESVNDVPRLSYSKWKRLTYNQRKESKQVLSELDNPLGPLE